MSQLSHFFLRAARPEDYEIIYIDASSKFASSTCIPAVRNALISKALEFRNVEWLLQINPSMGIDPSVPIQLIESAEDRDIKILSPLVFQLRNNLPVPVMGKHRLGSTFNWTEATGIIEADYIGADCLLAHHSVFEKIDPPWFENKLDRTGLLKMKADAYFCEKVLEAGFQPCIDANIIVDNYQKVPLKDYALAIDLALKSDSAEEFLDQFSEAGFVNKERGA